MDDWTGKLFEGMDTPDGALFGGLSLTTAFFPFFNSFLHIFPAPRGWSPWAAGILVTFSCLLVKLILQTYHREMALDLRAVQGAVFGFVGSLYMHYQPPAPGYGGAEDIVINLLFYVGLFACPTFAFTAMQFRRAQ